VTTKSLSLDIETLVELTPEAQTGVNGGFVTVSSPMPTPPVHPTTIQPTSTAVHPHPVPTPPVHKKHHKHHHH
jgi:hypothetical protein